MHRVFQHSGSLVLAAVGMYLWRQPPVARTLPVPPPAVHIDKSPSFGTGLITLATVATGGLCYWNGLGFADIAYATRRSVDTLSKQLNAAKNSILQQVKALETQLRGTEERLDHRIVDEAKRIRDNIEALHQEHRDLTTTVDHIDKKVTKIELLSLYSSKGVALLCDSALGSSGRGSTVGSFFGNKPT
jgi:hypothetical protein